MVENWQTVTLLKMDFLLASTETATTNDVLFHSKQNEQKNRNGFFNVLFTAVMNSMVKEGWCWENVPGRRHINKFVNLNLITFTIYIRIKNEMNCNSYTKHFSAFNSFRINENENYAQEQKKTENEIRN